MASRGLRFYRYNFMYGTLVAEGEFYYGYERRAQGRLGKWKFL